MRELKTLFHNNRRWAESMERQHPGFFAELAGQQAPKYLWIGCADSRVPANEIVGLLPGELFVHRNIANQAPVDDINCQSVLDFAIETLGVEHVIVCGHYGCGGVSAVVEQRQEGRVAQWLQPLDRVRQHHTAELAALPPADRHERLCELNVIAQVGAVSDSPAVRLAWSRGQRVSVHGWIYRVSDGLLRDFGLCVTAPEERDRACRDALTVRPFVPE